MVNYFFKLLSHRFELFQSGLPSSLVVSQVGVWPLDEHNAKLLDAVHPLSWTAPDRPKDFATRSQLLDGLFGEKSLGKIISRYLKHVTMSPCW